MTRTQWALVVVVLVMIAGMLAVFQATREAQDRPSVQRKTATELLADHAAVFAAYRQAHDGVWPPDLPSLRGFSKQLDEQQRLRFTSNLVPGTDIFYQYRPPTDDDQQTVVMASATPNRAVAADEEFGAKGEAAGERKAAVYYVLTAGLEVEALDPAAHRERAAWVHEADSAAEGG